LREVRTYERLEVEKVGSGLLLGKRYWEEPLAVVGCEKKLCIIPGKKVGRKEPSARHPDGKRMLPGQSVRGDQELFTTGSQISQAAGSFSRARAGN